VEEMGNAHRIFVGKPEGKNHLVDPAVNGMISLTWILKEVRYECVD
jgi:hypothetical protein